MRTKSSHFYSSHKNDSQIIHIHIFDVTYGLVWTEISSMWVISNCLSVTHKTDPTPDFTFNESIESWIRDEFQLNIRAF